MDWAALYPAYHEKSQEPSREIVEAAMPPKKLDRQVEIADIGCGFGGLLFGLAPVLPQTLILGMHCSGGDSW